MKHDITDPTAVSDELSRPFPPQALFREPSNGMTYVKYPQILRRLIYATGDRFSVDVLDQQMIPWGKTGKGHERMMLMATVRLTIPVLDSSRTHIGVQVATVNFGEDMWKGAVSDGIKKSAQAFGVAIELAGDDRDIRVDVDQETGEIQDSGGNAPQERVTAPPRPDSPPPVSDDQQDWETANRALHAIANDHHVTHDEIKAYAIQAARRKGLTITSTKEANANVLRFMAKAIKADADRFRRAARPEQDDDDAKRAAVMSAARDI